MQKQGTGVNRYDKPINHGDYLQAVRDMNAFLIELNELSATVNAAISPVIGVSFSDYFSFADTSVLRGDRH